MMRELSLNILDVAENSVSAKATLVEISIDVNTNANSMIILIVDNGKGMTEEQCRSVLSPFYTTRTTRKVGLGIPFFKMAAEITGGDLNITSKVGVGTTVKARFTYNHIDRMPLGDICSTVCALIRLNPKIDFIYFEKFDENEFVLDTRELRKILGDVPFSEPDVMNWISEYFQENSYL